MLYGDGIYIYLDNYSIVINDCNNREYIAYHYIRIK